MNRSLLLVVPASFALVTCGGSAREASDAGTTDAGLSDSGPGGCHQQLPSPPAAAAASPSSPLVYAIRTVDFGETSGWQHIGLDIDGKDTTASSTNVCQLAQGAPVTVQVDGSCGIDNSFGSNIVPAGAGTVAAQRNAAIAAGGPTDLLVLDGSVSGADATNVAGFIINGLALGHAPRWDGTDAWPVDANSLHGTNASSAAIAFPDGFRVGGQWFGARAIGPGSMTMGDEAPRWPLTDVSVSLTESGLNTVSGTLSGIIPTTDLVNLLTAFENATAQCSAGNDLVAIVAAASDILSDGTQDPSRPCNGISVAFNFTASLATLGSIQADPGLPGCGDGGM